MHDGGEHRPSTSGASDADAASPVRPASRWRSVRRFVDSWLRSLGIAFLLFLLIRTFFFEAFQIPSGSMERTLLSGDFLFVNKLVYGAEIPGTHLRLPAITHPERGDVIVFRYPRDPSLNYVKRVVAVGGDTVAMRQGRLFVNDTPMDEPYAFHADDRPDGFDPDFRWQREFYVGRRTDRVARHPTRDNWGPLRIPPGQYFVLGDNRDNSSDSRYWGFVAEGRVKGRPAFVYFSYERGAHEPLPWVTTIRWGRLGRRIR